MTATAEDRPIGQEINSDGKQFFENAVLDNVIESFVELAAEVWTHRDRTIVLETVLQKVIQDSGQNVDLGAMIEAHVPTAEEKAARHAERQEFINTVFRAFTRRT